MLNIPFEKLYNTEFIIKEPLVKNQFWQQRGNTYNAIGKPKISHTLLWFKNCSATITDKNGYTLQADRNQLAFMSKGTEYKVDFFNTNTDREDTVVIHFQMTDLGGEDICPVKKPTICIKNVDVKFSMLIDSMVDEFSNNIICMPKLKSSIYTILGEICQKQKRKQTRTQFTSVREGIKLLEQNSNMKIADIAEVCGVSECYFRRLFKEYSGESPMNFRQHYRIEKAKQLLLSDEGLTISEISDDLHFTDIYHFSKTFKKYTGVSPNNFLKTKERII